MKTKLFLEEERVHVGMTVALCLEGKKTPETDEEGDPLILRALEGGIPTRKKFYPLKGGIVCKKTKPAPPGFENTWPDKFIVAKSMENFRPEIRFTPTQVFSSDKAPPKTEFVVFVRDIRLRYEGSKNYVYILTDEKGRLLSHNGYEYDWWMKEYSLPKDALLIPITEIGQAYIKGIPVHPSIHP